LGISDLSLYLGFKALKYLGFIVHSQDHYLQMTWNSVMSNETKADNAINQFLVAVQEETFQQEYFTTVPISIIQALACNQ
jgi:single-stranded-DNA-specific exonuclease